MSAYSRDSRVVMTLDAGGTNFRFSAIRGNKPVTEVHAVHSEGDRLERCLENILTGFARIKEQCPAPPVAISFAFPGPADYPNGIIGDLVNLPAFRGGVALGPMIADHFGIPVFINNDGDLFTYGEAIAGLLPWVNKQLKQSGSARRYRNLFGVTIGTGFGGGIVRNGELFTGDNSIGGEVHAMRNKLHPMMSAEEGVSIRALRRVYAEIAGIPFEQAPEPKDLFAIGRGERDGNQCAAIESFRQLGEVMGDAMAQALTLVDGLAVVGGGVSPAWPLFLPATISELNSSYLDFNDRTRRRLTAIAFNLEDSEQLKSFLKDETREIKVPGSQRVIKYDSAQRTAVGISRLGTSQAIAIGAYAFALRQLDHVRTPIGSDDDD